MYWVRLSLWKRLWLVEYVESKVREHHQCLYALFTFVIKRTHVRREAQRVKLVRRPWGGQSPSCGVDTLWCLIACYSNFQKCVLPLPPDVSLVPLMVQRPKTQSLRIASAPYVVQCRLASRSLVNARLLNTDASRKCPGCVQHEDAT